MNKHCEPCPGGPHTYDADGNSICHIPTADQACGNYRSAGFGPEGDWEHSYFCATCGWESADHVVVCTCGEDDDITIDAENGIYVCMTCDRTWAI